MLPLSTWIDIHLPATHFASFGFFGWGTALVRMADHGGRQETTQGRAASRFMNSTTWNARSSRNSRFSSTQLAGAFTGMDKSVDAFVNSKILERGTLTFREKAFVTLHSPGSSRYATAIACLMGFLVVITTFFYGLETAVPGMESSSGYFCFVAVCASLFSIELTCRVISWPSGMRLRFMKDPIFWIE